MAKSEIVKNSQLYPGISNFTTNLNINFVTINFLINVVKKVTPNSVELTIIHSEQ